MGRYYIDVLRYSSFDRDVPDILSPPHNNKPNKKALSKVEKSLMVELAGTTPASASLSKLAYPTGVGRLATSMA